MVYSLCIGKGCFSFYYLLTNNFLCGLLVGRYYYKENIIELTTMVS
jgi:hypothetical protein